MQGPMSVCRGNAQEHPPRTAARRQHRLGLAAWYGARRVRVHVRACAKQRKARTFCGARGHPADEELAAVLVWRSRRIRSGWGVRGHAVRVWTWRRRDSAPVLRVRGRRHRGSGEAATRGSRCRRGATFRRSRWTETFLVQGHTSSGVSTPTRTRAQATALQHGCQREPCLAACPPTGLCQRAPRGPCARVWSVCSRAGHPCASRARPSPVRGSVGPALGRTPSHQVVCFERAHSCGARRRPRRQRVAARCSSS